MDNIAKVNAPKTKTFVLTKVASKVSYNLDPTHNLDPTTPLTHLGWKLGWDVGGTDEDVGGENEVYKKPTTTNKMRKYLGE